jgi:solute:Na+ symporter, SSS family
MLVHLFGMQKGEDRTRPEDYLDVVEG